MDFNSLNHGSKTCPIPFFPWPELQWDEIRPQVQCPLVPTTPGCFCRKQDFALQLEKHPDPNRKWFVMRGCKVEIIACYTWKLFDNSLIWHVRILYDKQYWKSHRIPSKISTRKWLSSDIPCNPYIFHVLSLNFTTKGEVQWKICWNQPYDTRIIDVERRSQKVMIN